MKKGKKRKGGGGSYMKAASKRLYRKNMVKQIDEWKSKHPDLGIFRTGFKTMGVSKSHAEIHSQFLAVEVAVKGVAVDDDADDEENDEENDVGLYDPDHEYMVGDLCVDSADGLVYRCTTIEDGDEHWSTVDANA